MNYEEKYKEALEKAKKLYEQGTITESLSNVFPELKESKEEKIRKELLESFKYQQRESRTDKEWLNGIKLSEVVAWLEKQAPKNKTTIDKAIEEEVDAWLEKQGKKHSAIRWYDVSLIPQEMEELLVEWDSEDATWHEIAFYHADTKTFWDGERQVENVTRWCYIVDLLEKQGEQKPVDKVESKFKVGDWIVSSVLGTAHIIGVNDSNEYQLEYIDGKQKFSSIDYVNYEYDEWTIEDAKDGDVLFIGIDGSTCIFKKLEGSLLYSHIISDGKLLVEDSHYYYETSDNIHPATKEQRDLLFQKIHDTGYEWNAEKKEVKKIKNFPILSNSAKTGKNWSEEDEKCIDNCCLLIGAADNCYEKTFKDDCIHYLQNLKQRMKQ